MRARRSQHYHSQAPESHLEDLVQVWTHVDGSMHIFLRGCYNYGRNDNFLQRSSEQWIWGKTIQFQRGLQRPPVVGSLLTTEEDETKPDVSAFKLSWDWGTPGIEYSEQALHDSASVIRAISTNFQGKQTLDFSLEFVLLCGEFKRLAIYKFSKCVQVQHHTVWL